VLAAATSGGRVARSGRSSRSSRPKTTCCRPSAAHAPAGADQAGRAQRRRRAGNVRRHRAGRAGNRVFTVRPRRDGDGDRGRELPATPRGAVRNAERGARAVVEPSIRTTLARAGEPGADRHRYRDGGVGTPRAPAARFPAARFCPTGGIDVHRAGDYRAIAAPARDAACLLARAGPAAGRPHACGRCLI